MPAGVSRARLHLGEALPGGRVRSRPRRGTDPHASSGTKWNRFHPGVRRGVAPGESQSLTLRKVLSQVIRGLITGPPITVTWRLALDSDPVPGKGLGGHDRLEGVPTPLECEPQLHSW